MEPWMEPWLLTPWIELDAVIRLAVAGIVGGLIGWERESADKPAGLRTNILVCTGAALISITSIYGFGPDYDTSRVAAGIVVGIGFLGAGTIIRGEGGMVTGLTTAATVWTVAAIGMTLGSGLYAVGMAAFVIVLAALRLLPHRR